MEHLHQKSKCSVLHNIFKYMILPRRQKALLWSNRGLILTPINFINGFLLLVEILNLVGSIVYIEGSQVIRLPSISLYLHIVRWGGIQNFDSGSKS